MSKEHHIPEEFIVAYAAGTLSEGKSVLVASHVEFHEALKARVRDAETIGGVLLEQEEGVDMSASALESALEKIELPFQDINQETDQNYDCPKALGDYIQKNLNDLNWRFMGPGMRQAKLWSSDNGETLWLLKARGGTHIPIHDHKGQELTLILQGSYKVGTNHFRAGDIEIADQSTISHQPVIDEGEDCICLVVTDAPIAPHGLLARLAQPFIGL